MGHAASFALLTALAGSEAQAAEKIDVAGKSVGPERDLVFKWPQGVEATAKIDRRTLTISFARPFDADVAHIADLVAGFGTFVRLSADGKTLNINLMRDMAVAAERGGNSWTIRIAPPAVLAKTQAVPPVAEAQAKPQPKAEAKAAPKTESKKAEDAPAPDATPQVAHPELTVSEAQGYTRLAFEWPKPVDYTADLVEGELTVKFTSAEEVRLADLRVTPPKRVRGAEGTLDNGTFTARIKVDPGIMLRHAKDGDYVFIDLVDPEPDKTADANAKAKLASATPPAVLSLMVASPLLSPQTGNPPASAADAGKAAAPKAVAPDTIKNILSFNDIDASVLEDRVNGKTVDAEPEGETGTVAATEPLSVAVAPSAQFAMNVAVDSRTIKLGFPWGSAVPAAVVRRGDRLWIAFARDGQIDVSTVERVRAQGVISAEVYQAQNATVVGLKLADHLLATAIPEEDGWTIALGDAILTPTPDVALEKRITDKTSEIAAKLPGETALTHFKDPDVGDDLLFVMAGAPSRGFVSTRHYVDFDLLAATQGVVVRPVSDGVDVRLEPDYAVITMSGMGLHVAGTNLVTPGSARAILNAHQSPSEMKFAEWRGPASVPFTDAYQKLIAKASAAEDSDRPQINLELAHFLMGYGLYEEALGVLNVAQKDAPQIANDEHFRILRGVASLLASRPKVAEPDLDSQQLPDDPDSSLWVAMLASAEQDFPRARIYFTRAEPAIQRLDNGWQAKARIKAAEAGLEINDFGWARDELDLMPNEGLARAQTDEGKLLRARLAEAMGDPKHAAIAYEALTHSPIEPVAVKAQLDGTLLAVHQGKLATNDAIDRLEALRFEWRGDATEAQTLLALGQMYGKLGDYRHALSTMRIAVRQFPGTPTERRIYDQMANLFEDLFLRGKADQMPPIQALALYFDFKELTPIGPKGDVMIRRLCDRLVAMDLLDQATDLLKHQVDNRLSGVARSQVAARLAMVQLMNHKPEDALMTINDTRQARLPEDVSAQRRLIEARSLMDLKRYEHALDVISGDDGTQVERLRADVYWHAEDWAKAGPALEQGLAQAYASPEPLSDAQRFDVMRAAISYALGNDGDGLSRVKAEYSAKIHQTPDAHAFDVVTSAPGQGSVELYSLAEKFSGIDTLADFLTQMKDPGENAKIN